MASPTVAERFSPGALRLPGLRGYTAHEDGVARCRRRCNAGLRRLLAILGAGEGLRDREILQPPS